jgi:dolichol kinase
MFVFKEPYLFFSFALAFTIALLIPHIRSKEMRWFQVKDNFGEVFYTLSFAILSIILWESNRTLAGTSMLFMSVGDSITGMIRSRFVHERKKHWSGSLGMLLTCSIIGYAMLGLDGFILSAVATLAEFQPWIDDNLMVPFATTFVKSLI